MNAADSTSAKLKAARVGKREKESYSVTDRSLVSNQMEFVYQESHWGRDVSAEKLTTQSYICLLRSKACCAQ